MRSSQSRLLPRSARSVDHATKGPRGKLKHDHGTQILDRVRLEEHPSCRPVFSQSRFVSRRTRLKKTRRRVPFATPARSARSIAASVTARIEPAVKRLRLSSHSERPARTRVSADRAARACSAAQWPPYPDLSSLLWMDITTIQ